MRFVPLFFCLPIAAQTQQKVNIGFKATPLITAFEEIEQKAHLKLAYNPEEIDKDTRLNLSKQNRSVQTLFSEISKQTNLDFIKIKNFVAITPRISRKIEEGGQATANLLPLRGQVLAEEGYGIPGVVVAVKGSNKATITDNYGFFVLNVAENEVLQVASLGFQKQEVLLGQRQNLKITLKEESHSLNEVAVVGSRSPSSRAYADTPAPVDVISAKELAQTGQTDLGQMLAYLAPSFNSSRQTIADGTDHIDPMTLRGLGPDQVLVLINGKRRHTTALVNVNSTVGRGSVGTDLNALPASAIERIEILRDGAAAQYGSDAIAGVINIVLKNHASPNSLQTQTGITAKGDGLVTQGSVFQGISLGKKGGGMGITAEWRQRQATNRSGVYNGLVYLPALSGSPTASQIAANAQADEELVRLRSFDRRCMVVGNSEASNQTFFLNYTLPLANKWEMYGFGGANFRQGKSAGFYRFPNNYRVNNLSLYPNGYLPQILTDISDKSLAVGIRKTPLLGWNFDWSMALGGNDLGFGVKNSLNASMRDASPTEFNIGQLGFWQQTNNLTVSRQFRDKDTQINFALGVEYRSDRYQIRNGEPNSYSDANPAGTLPTLIKAAGSQVLSGFRPQNAVNVARSNLSFYGDIEAEISHSLLLNGALRFENYSDFGSNLSGKLVGRYQFSEAFLLRGGINRGFRAPSLHQKYYSSVSTQFITINGVNQQREVSTLTNDSPVVRNLGVPSLQPETSTSYNLGVTSRLSSQLTATVLTATVDAYQIDIYNRIVISGRFSSSLPQLTPYFQNTAITEAQFFTNAIDTRTRGLDVMLNYRTHWGLHSLRVTSALNLNQTTIQQPVRTPTPLTGLGETLLNREERGRIEVNQPQSKLMTSAHYQYQRWGAMFRFTRFGSIATIAPQDPLQDQVFSTKTITDTQFSYRISSKVTMNVGANNVFDVYPDKVADARLTNNNTVIYSRFATQFGFNGAYYYGSLQIDW